jgi:IclR family pca regulon transcriptional regulator
MGDLAAATGETCTAAVLDPPDVVLVAATEPRQLMHAEVGVGTRLPAYVTAAGRVLLAALPPESRAELLRDAELTAYTPRTITDASVIRRSLEEIGQRGWALVDQELEIDLRSIAVPLHDRRDRVVAALSLEVSASRMSVTELTDVVRPSLSQAARTISATLRFRAA